MATVSSTDNPFYGFTRAMLDEAKESYVAAVRGRLMQQKSLAGGLLMTGTIAGKTVQVHFPPGVGRIEDVPRFLEAAYAELDGTATRSDREVGRFG